MRQLKIRTEREYYEKMLKPFLEKNGFNVHKVTEKYKSGRPDILALKNGMTYYIEAKYHGKWVTKLQEKTMKELAKLGAPVFLFQYDKVLHDHIIYWVVEGGSFIMDQQSEKHFI